MNGDVMHINNSTPAVGIAMTAAGVGGWLASSTVKLFATTTVPVSGVVWPGFGQLVSGAAVILGASLTWYLASRDQIHKADLKMREDEAASTREQRLLDALADIRIEQERHRTEMAGISGHLERQDAAIQGIAVGAVLTAEGKAP